MNTRFTVLLAFDSSRDPVRFSVNLEVVVAGLFLVVAFILGVAMLWQVDLGEETITENMERGDRTQANLDAVLNEIELLAPAARNIDAQIEPLFDLLTPAIDQKDEAPGALTYFQDQTFFGPSVLR